MTDWQDGDEGMLIIGRACNAQIGLILTAELLIFFPLSLPTEIMAGWQHGIFGIFHLKGTFEHTFFY